jgi:hypothetical protein
MKFDIKLACADKIKRRENYCPASLEESKLGFEQMHMRVKIVNLFFLILDEPVHEGHSKIKVHKDTETALITTQIQLLPHIHTS